MKKKERKEIEMIRQNIMDSYKRTERNAEYFLSSMYQYAVKNYDIQFINDEVLRYAEEIKKERVCRKEMQEVLKQRVKEVEAVENYDV